MNSTRSRHRSGRNTTTTKDKLAETIEQAEATLLDRFRQGRYQEALSKARSFTSRWPNNSTGWIVRAQCLQTLGQSDEAIRAFRRVLKIDPQDAEIENSLGVILQNMPGRTQEAVDAYRRALSIQPDFLAAHNNLGMSLTQLDQDEEAERAFRQALEIDPNYAIANNNLGNILRKTRRLKAAVSCFRRAIRNEPHYAEAHNNLANALRDLEQQEEAEKSYLRAVELKPDYARAWNNLGILRSESGHIEQAREAYRRALKIIPDYVEAWCNLAQVKKFQPNDPDLANIENLLKLPKLSTRDRVNLNYSAGKGYADIGAEPDRAFSHYLEGARLERAQIDYDVGMDEQLFVRIAEVFNTGLLAQLPVSGDTNDAPIFVIGMPRSGTTLVEQILASHSCVHAAGERRDLEDLVIEENNRQRISFPNWASTIESSELNELGRIYRVNVVDPVSNRKRVVDKMPTNFRYLGLITGILPNARIIHVRRNPLDTCLSCFMQLFTGNLPFTYDLAELGRYYQAYSKLMDHWSTVLPQGRFFEVSYENLVTDPEPVIRDLLTHCGLRWEPECLNFYQTRRSIRTASVMQVRVPLYQRSIGRWKPYREYLAPLIEALGSVAKNDQ